MSGDDLDGLLWLFDIETARNLLGLTDDHEENVRRCAAMFGITYIPKNEEGITDE